MRRIPKQRLLRGLLRGGLIQKTDIPLIEERLKETRRYHNLNTFFSKQRGHRWSERLQNFIAWLWKHREAILQILGLVIMFADDGTPYAEKEEVAKAKEAEKAKPKRKRRPKKTPDGEKVEDFTESKDATSYDIGITTPEGSEDAEGDRLQEREEETREETQGEVSSDEVQSGEAGSEATDRLKSDDV